MAKCYISIDPIRNSLIRRFRSHVHRIARDGLDATGPDVTVVNEMCQLLQQDFECRIVPMVDCDSVAFKGHPANDAAR